VSRKQRSGPKTLVVAGADQLKSDGLGIDPAEEEWLAIVT